MWQQCGIESCYLSNTTVILNYLSEADLDALDLTAFK